MRPHTTAARWLVAVAALLAAAAPGAAQAAPPANDDVAHATPVGPTPFRTAESTLAATAAASDPADCSGDHSVWFTFTPPAAAAVQIDAFLSDYPAKLALYTGPPDSLTLATCEPGELGGRGAVRLDAAAGTTYWIEAFTCCGDTGGNLVLRVAAPPPPLTATMQVRRAVVDRLGFLRVSGTVTCNQLALVGLDGSVLERVGIWQLGARWSVDFNDHPLRCSRTPVAWSAITNAQGDRRFQAGHPAAVGGNAFAYDGFRFADPLPFETFLHVQRSRHPIGPGPLAIAHPAVAEEQDDA